MKKMNYAYNYLSKNFHELEIKDFYNILFSQYSPKFYYSLIITEQSVFTKRTQNKVISGYTLEKTQLSEIQDLMELRFGCYRYLAPISFAGKSKCASNARQLFAIVFEIDYPQDFTQKDFDHSLKTFFHRCTNAKLYGSENLPLIPMPTMVVSSGLGVHLYYVLNKPLNMFKNIQESIQKFRSEFIDRIWNEDFTPVKKQNLPVVQSYRMIRSQTKYGTVTSAFLTGDVISIETLNCYVSYENRIKSGWESNISLEEAKNKWPDWYERVIVKKEKKTGWDAPHWSCNKNLYYWWLHKIKINATVGHRYNCVRCLAIIAVKCKKLNKDGNDIGITYEQLKKDAYDLIDVFEEKTISEDNHFTEEDVKAALLNYQPMYFTYPISSISYISGIHIEKNKRNKGKNQLWHLEDIRDIKKKMKERGIKFKNDEGRPTKSNIVIEYRINNPSASKLQCAKDLNISRNTVRKWWDSQN